VDDTDHRTKTFAGFPGVEEGGEGRDAPPLAIGRLLGGRFLIQSLLGEGASGVVYAALDQEVGQRVALKMLRPELVDPVHRERFRREVRSARHGHPNAVTVHDLHELDGRLVLSMELVSGASLRALLSSSERLSIDDTLSVARQMAAALEHLHGHGLVHRDVKPGNILITPDGTAKLCDMGLARPVEQGVTVTESQMVVGTPAYMAPEQATGAELTAASDVYGLGLTLFQCLTGEVPLTAPTAVSTLAIRQRAAAPSARKLAAICPRWFDRLLRRMLDRDPTARPSAAAIVRLLAAERVPIRVRRRHVVAAAAVVALMLAGTWAVRSLSHEVVAVAEVENGVLLARGTKGQVLWRRELVGSWHRLLRTDLDRDGSAEIIVTASEDVTVAGRKKERLASEVLVLREDGQPLTGVRPDRFVAGWSYPYRVDLNPIPQLLDLDGDGWDELVINCNQVNFYPSVVLVYWPRHDIWENLLHHPGRIYSLGVAPAAGEAHLLFSAINNVLGMLPVVADIGLGPPTGRTSALNAPRLEGPPAAILRSREGAEWRAYVPVEPSDTASEPPGEGTIGFRWLADGGLEALMFGETVRFDAHFNPVPGPNLGADRRGERADFFRFINRLQQQNQPSTGDQVRALANAARASCGNVLAERPYRAILDIETARALARAGDVRGGIAVLAETQEQVPFDDVRYRLANLWAVDGDLGEAEDLARSIADQRLAITRRRYDAQHLILRLAIELRDRTMHDNLWRTFARRITGETTPAAFGSALRARAMLWWDELSAADTRVRSVAYEPAGDALAVLARWRLGQADPGDTAAMELFVKTQDDAVFDGRLALSAAQLGAARPTLALETLEQLTVDLEIASRDDFSNLQLLRLARAMHARALLDAGFTDQARQEAATLAATLDPSLLPGILVAEVLRETAPST
jgi:tRNA A-37 threonylcarbamoyl transferase component Bud32